MREKPTRVQIRPGNYRGKSGYLVTGSYGHGFPARIFVRRRDSAEQIRDVLKSSLPLTKRATAIDRILRSESEAARG